MRLLTKLIAGLLLLFLASCSKQIDVLQYPGYVLVAQGEALSLEDAKSVAIANLSKSILSNVQSTTTATLVLKQDLFEETYRDDMLIHSVGFFDNVVFIDSQRRGKYYIVTAGIDDVSVASTIRFLNNQLIMERIDTVPRSVKKLQLYKANFLLALQMFADAKNIEYNKINNLDTYINQLNQQVLSAGSIKLIVSPENIRYNVLVDNKEYEQGAIIHLDEGMHNLLVTSDGYIDYKDRINIELSSDLKLPVIMQKKFDNPFKFQLIVDNNSSLDTDDLQDSLSAFFAQYQIDIVDKSENKILIKTYNIKHSSKVGTFYNVTIGVLLKMEYQADDTLIKEFNVLYLNAEDEINIPNNYFMDNFSDKSKFDVITFINHLSNTNK